MKLYNRTRIPDEVLRALLVKAGRSVGARTGNVAVQVNPANVTSKGCAYNWDLLRIRGQWVKVDGFFKIWLARKTSDPIQSAQNFLLTARHEFGHIRDYQAGGRDRLEWSRRGPGGRRPLHDSRPEEIRANDYIYDSDQRLKNKPGYFDEEVLALAIELEKLNKS